MASGGSHLDRSNNFIGSFSVLEGVMVKLSDEFRPPKKVSLPVGWRPIEIKTLAKFDFAFEEDVIKMVEQEKLQAEKEKQATELDNFLNEPENENESIQSDPTDQGTEAVGTNNEGTAEDTEIINDIKEAPILEPVKMNHGPLVARGSKNVRREFNFSEFEDISATPFELVELQTLDDISELKSVLQPDCAKNKKPLKSRQRASITKPDDDIDFSIFNTPFTSSMPSESTATSIATASLIQGLEPDRLSGPAVPLPAHQDVAYKRNHPVPVTTTSYLPLERRFESLGLNGKGKEQRFAFETATIPVSMGAPTRPSVYPVGTSVSLPFSPENRFSSQHFQNSNLQNQFIPLDLHKGANNDSKVFEEGLVNPSWRTGHSFTPRYETGSFDFERTNLSKANSKSLPNLAEASFECDKRQNEDSERQRKSPNEFHNQMLSTSRIDNIMKKFQLDRLREFDGVPVDSASIPIEQSAAQSDATASVNTRSNSRHVGLPALQTSPRSVSYSPFNSLVQTSPSYDSASIRERKSPADDEGSKRVGRLEPLQYKNNLESKGSDRTKKLSIGEPLPPIASPSPSRSPPSNFVNDRNAVERKGTSWLEDPAKSLTPAENNVVMMVAGMGFPKARTARAVLRLKDDEKEIIDFLVQVQQFAELGFDEDDVEMALIHGSEKDKDSILSYLNLVNKWKELGFPIQKVHDALSKTNKENEAVFEYLTT